MPEIWTTDEKNSLAKALCRTDVLSQPFSGKPFGRVTDWDEFRTFLEPDGRSDAHSDRSIQRQVTKMLREDFFPLADEVPYYVKERFGVAASGSALVKWIYDEYDLYPEEKKTTNNNNDNKKNEEYETDNEDVGGEEEKNKDDNDGAVANEPDDLNKKTDAGAAPRSGEPSEEYRRQVEEYYDWVVYKPEELPDVQFPWEAYEGP